MFTTSPRPVLEAPTYAQANRISKKRYAELGEILTAASNELAPVMQNLNDQILYLG